MTLRQIQFVLAFVLLGAAGVQAQHPQTMSTSSPAPQPSSSQLRELSRRFQACRCRAESTVQFLDQNYLYTRLEQVDKDDLLRPSDHSLLGITQHHPVFRIGACTFSGGRDIWNSEKVSLAIGANVTLYSQPAILDRIYGNNSVGWRLFVRVRPGQMDMSAYGMHGSMSSDNKRKP
jgi:hypothetical protein